MTVSGPTSQSLVELRQVRKSYGQKSVLQVDELMLASGECVVITGGNGSGKTTLLKVCAGIAAIDRGGTIWRSEALTTAAGGYLPQSGGLYPNLTVWQNLALRQRLFALPGAPGPNAGRFVSALGLDDLANRRYADLSGGFQRLASIAVTLEMSPVWLFLDEPFSGVDQTNRQAIHATLAAVAPSLRLMLISTPRGEEFSFANRTIHLEQGQIV